MKKIIYLISILFLSLTSCLTQGELDRASTTQYQLRKFNVNTETHKSSSGSFFLVFASYSNGEHTATRVKFYFKNDRGEYTPVDVDRNQVRIVINDTIQIPTVRFTWNLYDALLPDKHLNTVLKRCMDNVSKGYGYIDYITVTCKESDFPSDLNILNLN